MITAFLSFSGEDEKFVKQVHDRLPDGLAYFYPLSFTNGENLIQAMEERVRESTVFVFFASCASAASHWVNFEIDQARIQVIVKSNFRLLVFPIDREVRRSDLPRWMSDYWIAGAGGTSSDVARYIRGTILLQLAVSSPSGKTYGRGSFLDASIEMLSQATVAAKIAPNVFIFAGVNGIGRRTVAREFLEKGFPAARDLNIGPELNLTQFADLQDVYRSLRQEIDPSFSLELFANDLSLFNGLKQIEKVSEVVSNMNHIFDLGQSIIIVTRNGIFEDQGNLKGWVHSLFEERGKNRTGKLCIITNRLIHQPELNKHPNVLQFPVPPLNDGAIKTIIVAMAETYQSSPALPNDDTIRAIGGHPTIAKIASKLIAERGTTIFNDDPRFLFHIQDDVLKECLDVRFLLPIEAEVISVLSWLPQLPGNLLSKMFTKKYGIDRQEFAKILDRLVQACLIIPSGENMMISSAIRAYFRRHYGYGASELRKYMFEILEQEWKSSHKREQTRSELFDAFVFMCALEGGTLPPEFKQLLLPSTLQELVRETYDSGHEDPTALRRVVTWGQPARTMGMDETTREEILSYVVRALVRLGDRDEEVTDLLSMFLNRGYRSYYFLNGFYLKRRNRLSEAVGSFLEAKKAKKYKGSVVGELADCYKLLGKWSELRELIKEQESYLDKNPNLLDIYAGMLIAERKWLEAEKIIRRLESLPRNDGRAECRRASMLMQKEGDFKSAADSLTRILTTVSRGRDNVRRLRALAATYSGDLKTARSDVDYLRSRSDGPYSVRRIETAILLKEQRFDEALEHWSRFSNPNAADYLLKARLLEAKGNNALIPISERERLKEEAVMLRARYGIVDEFGDQQIPYERLKAAFDEQ